MIGRILAVSKSGLVLWQLWHLRAILVVVVVGTQGETCASRPPLDHAARATLEGSLGEPIVLRTVAALRDAGFKVPK